MILNLARRNRDRRISLFDVSQREDYWSSEAKDYDASMSLHNIFSWSEGTLDLHYRNSEFSERRG